MANGHPPSGGVPPILDSKSDFSPLPSSQVAPATEIPIQLSYCNSVRSKPFIDISKLSLLPEFAIKEPIFTEKGGIKAILFHYEEIEAATRAFQFALVVRFHGPRPPVDNFERHVNSSWKLKDPAVVGLLDPRHIMIRLASESDFIKAWSREDCTFNSVRFVLLKWAVGFSENKVIKRAIWIELQRLPVVYHPPAFLTNIGNSIGRFLKLDDRTKAGKHPIAPRLCIELDFAKPLPKMVWVGYVTKDGEHVGFNQEITYDFSRSTCSYCRKVGHEFIQCPKRGVTSPVAALNRQSLDKDHPNQKLTPKKVWVKKNKMIGDIVQLGADNVSQSSSQQPKPNEVSSPSNVVFVLKEHIPLASTSNSSQKLQDSCLQGVKGTTLLKEKGNFNAGIFKEPTTEFGGNLLSNPLSHAVQMDHSNCPLSIDSLGPLKDLEDHAPLNNEAAHFALIESEQDQGRQENIFEKDTPTTPCHIPLTTKYSPQLENKQLPIPFSAIVLHGLKELAPTSNVLNGQKDLAPKSHESTSPLSANNCSPQDGNKQLSLEPQNQLAQISFDSNGILKPIVVDQPHTNVAQVVNKEAQSVGSILNPVYSPKLSTSKGNPTSSCPFDPNGVESVSTQLLDFSNSYVAHISQVVSLSSPTKITISSYNSHGHKDLAQFSNVIEPYVPPPIQTFNSFGALSVARTEDVENENVSKTNIVQNTHERDFDTNRNELAIMLREEKTKSQPSFLDSIRKATQRHIKVSYKARRAELNSIGQMDPGN